MKAYFSRKSDEWATPQSIFDELDAEFHFTLDPCSTDENCKCEKHYTIQDDGLSKMWGGNEYSAIHHIAGLKNGLRNAFMKHNRMTPLSLC